jgi:ferredoxin-NADP reductase
VTPFTEALPYRANASQRPPSISVAIYVVFALDALLVDRFRPNLNLTFSRPSNSFLDGLFSCNPCTDELPIPEVEVPIGEDMHDSLLSVVVTRKWQLAESYHAVELQTRSRSELPSFDDGACVTLALDNIVSKGRTYPLCSFASRPRAYVIAVRQDDGDTDTETADISLSQGDEAFIETPRSPAVILDGPTRSILFAGGVGAASIAGIAKQLDAAGQKFELHNFARSPERAVFREELDALKSEGRVHHHFGLDAEQLEQATSHAMSPAHANTQIYCSGPPAFMDLIARQAREWVYPGNIHKIVLGDRINS